MNITKLLTIMTLIVGVLMVSACSPATAPQADAMDKDDGMETKTMDVKVDTMAKAPDFSVTTTQGRAVSLMGNVEAQKPTVVYFMASWCSTCAKNWEALNQVYPDYKDKVDFVAISVDPTDSDEVLMELAKEKGFTFETVAGNVDLALAYEVKKQTAKFAIDKNGEVVERHDGALTAEEWKAFFDKALGEEMMEDSMEKDAMADDAMEDKAMEEKEMEDKAMEAEMADDEMEVTVVEVRTPTLAQAPDFSVTTSQGRAVSLTENVDEQKPTVVYFMASWCSTCAKNWAALNAVYPEYEHKVDFVAVSVDPTDSDEVLLELAEEKGFAFETVAGNPGLALDYEVTKQTAKFAISKDGELVERHDGALTQDEWRDFFEAALRG